MWPLSLREGREGGKALVTGPLKKLFYSFPQQTRPCSELGFFFTFGLFLDIKMAWKLDFYILRKEHLFQRIYLFYWNFSYPCICILFESLNIIAKKKYIQKNPKELTIDAFLKQKQQKVSQFIHSLMSHTCVDMCGEVLKLPVKPLVRLVLLNYINFSCFQLHISSLCRGIYSQVIYIVHFDHFPIPIPPPPL